MPSDSIVCMYRACITIDHDLSSSYHLDNSSRDYVTTANGSLVITTRAKKTSWTEWDAGSLRPVTATKNYTSGNVLCVILISSSDHHLDGFIYPTVGMVQSWNKFCFTGGVLEMSIKLPGSADSGGTCILLSPPYLSMVDMLGDQIDRCMNHIR